MSKQQIPANQLDQQLDPQQQTANKTDKKAAKKAAKQAAKKAPKGWIRWSGLVSFLVIAGLVIGLVYLINSFGLKKLIEQQASEAWGAKVEIGSVGFGISPLGLKLDNLQITDPENTKTNLVELEKISLTLNLYHAVVGRFVVEDMMITGLKLDQPRKTDGALSAETLAKLARLQAEKERKQAEAEPFELPSIDLPDAKEIMARERLDTVDAAKDLENQIDQVEQQWKEIQAKLPTAEKLKSYEQQVNEVFASKIKDLKDFDAAKKKLDQIKKAWRQDQQALADAQKFLQQNQQQLSKQIASLPGMPNQDLQRLLGSYSLDESGLSNVTFLLFGSAAQDKIDTALDWYRKAEPLIAWLKEYQAEQKAAEKVEKPSRFAGENIEFREFDPQPKFMVKRINFNGEIDWGQLQLKAWDLNFDHKNSQKPVRFAMFAQPETQQAGLVVEGTSSAIDTDQVITQGTAHWQNYQLQDWWMSKSDGLMINLASSNVDINADFELHDLARLDTQLKLDYQQAKFDLSASKSKDVVKYLSPVFADIDQFLVEIGIGGKPWAPGFKANSDLDSKLSAGIKRVMKQQLAEFEASLKVELNAKLKQLSQPLEQDLAKLGLDLNSVKDAGQLITKLENQADNEIKAVEKELKAKLDAEKNKATKKLEDKLKKALPF